jgi:hypothetical protein
MLTMVFGFMQRTDHRKVAATQPVFPDKHLPPVEASRRPSGQSAGQPMKNEVGGAYT